MPGEFPFTGCDWEGLVCESGAGEEEGRWTDLCSEDPEEEVHKATQTREPCAD